MNSNKKVTVLTPHGRRYNVEISLGTTILQILEQTCTKYDFPSSEYGLKHHNKEIDLSLMFRFSGLPNNCVLEMFPTEKIRNDNNDVVLCVQLEDGTRQQANFTSNTNISLILQNLCPNESTPDKHPVVIYMRREIYGENLKTTTLKSLGITGGRAIIRLLNKNPEDLKTQASVYTPSVFNKKEVNEEVNKTNDKKKNITTEKQCNDLKEEKKNLDVEKKVEDKKEIVSEKDSINIKPDWGSGSGRTMNEEKKLNEIETCVTTFDEIEEPTFIELGERNAVIFSLEDAQKVPVEIPDSFFELTVDDLKLLLRDLREEQQTSEHAPLLTEKLRELERNNKILNKMKQYKKCVIRIQFPDRLVLQGTFKPIDTVNEVYAFVRKYIKDDTIKFFLFTIPPRTILPLDKTLLEVDCIPTALLHFGIEDGNENQLSYFKEEILLKLTSPEGALLLASKSRGMVFTPSVDKTVANEESLKCQQQQKQKQQQPGPSSGAIPKKELKSTISNIDEKVPKWFKPQ